MSSTLEAYLRKDQLVGPMSEDRWIEAEQRISRQISPERRRANRRSWLLLIGAAAAYGVVVGLVRYFTDGGNSSAPDSAAPLPPAFWVGIALASAGALMILIGSVFAFVTKRLLPTWERVDGALNGRERRSARRQIRGSEPIVEQHQAVVAAIAEQDLHAARALVPCYLGAALMAAGLALTLDLPETTAGIAGLLVLLAAVAVWQYGVTVPASRRYLTRERAR
ncbi:hypothetical protein [Amnibacterium endophyticum]|uniref:DUF2157 domain-containing protein n=1 Tax=Amnibacterium endophyticum TaxID=2109337 RepID=A0ABW4LEC0_9MICO